MQEATRLVAISSGDLKKFSNLVFLGSISPVPLFVVRAFLFAAIHPKSRELKPCLQAVFYSIKKYVSKGIAN